MNMRAELTRGAGYQAFWVLRVGLGALMILAGFDKVQEIVTDSHIFVAWHEYLAHDIPETLNIGEHALMSIVGFLEILLGIVLLVWPSIGGYVLALWMLGIIINIVISQEHWDIALRDFAIGAAGLALGRLGQEVRHVRAASI